jgi:DinB superfamily
MGREIAVHELHKEAAIMNTSAIKTTETNENKGVNGSISVRAAALADRIEEGAALLAAFAEGLSEEEWLMPVSATDRRPVGVIVHHVASMYPVEIDAVKAIAAGIAVTDVTWEAVAGINAGHADEHRDVTKSEAIELLRRNSRTAADSVRGLTDEELDRSAPFSLSYGAPMTAQFVIEDHPLRHAWHHLARIRAAVSR